MVYEWKKGSHIKVNAQIAGEMCEKLNEEGQLNAKTLVDMNRAEDAPLHDAFEWNDGVAAEKYRESQATHIINCLITKHDGSSEPTRTFFKLERTDTSYEHIDIILRNEDMTLQLLNQAMTELKWFRKKYGSLKQLSKLFDAIDELTA